MKNMFFLFIALTYSVSIRAGGNELTRSSNIPGTSTSQTEVDNNKDQTIIDDFLGLCRNQLQEVTTQLGRLDQTTRTIILNSLYYSEVYTKGLAELDVVSSWAQRDPHTVAVLIASISQKR
jgi:hypothetical protein